MKGRPNLLTVISVAVLLGMATVSSNQAANAAVYWKQVGQVLAGPEVGSEMGIMSLSDDGQTIAVGAPVYSLSDGYAAVFQLVDGEWVPKGEPFVGEIGEFNGLGSSVDLNSDGSVVAIGVPGPGINISAGEVRTFTWNEVTEAWDGPQIVSGSQPVSLFGAVVRLDETGDRLLVSAPYLDANDGAVYVYSRGNHGEPWLILGSPITGSGGDSFGTSADFSADGQRLIATNMITPPNKGFVSIHHWDGVNWSEEWSLVGEAGEYLGLAATIDGDGSTALIGINLNQVAVYTRTGVAWSESGRITDLAGDNEAIDALDGSNDGETFVARKEGRGLPFNPLVVYSWVGGSWEQLGSQISSAGNNSSFGQYLSISGDGTRIAGGNFGRYNGIATGFVQIFDATRPRHRSPNQVLTLDPAGGVCLNHSSSWTQTFRRSFTLPTANDCQRDGYAFLGWTRDPLLTAPENLLTNTVTRSGTLTAVWGALPAAPIRVDVIANFLCVQNCTSAIVVWPTSTNPTDTVQITIDNVEAVCSLSGQVFGLVWCWVTGLAAGSTHNASVSWRNQYGSGPAATAEFALA